MEKYDLEELQSLVHNYGMRVVLTQLANIAHREERDEYHREDPKRSIRSRCLQWRNIRQSLVRIILNMKETIHV